MGLDGMDGPAVADAGSTAEPSPPAEMEALEARRNYWRGMRGAVHLAMPPGRGPVAPPHVDGDEAPAPEETEEAAD